MGRPSGRICLFFHLGHPVHPTVADTFCDASALTFCQTRSRQGSSRQLGVARRGWDGRVSSEAARHEEARRPGARGCWARRGEAGPDARAPSRRGRRLRRPGAHTRGEMPWPGAARRGAREGLLCHGRTLPVTTLVRSSLGCMESRARQNCTAAVEVGEHGGGSCSSCCCS